MRSQASELPLVQPASWVFNIKRRNTIVISLRQEEFTSFTAANSRECSPHDSPKPTTLQSAQSALMIVHENATRQQSISLRKITKCRFDGQRVGVKKERKRPQGVRCLHLKLLAPHCTHAKSSSMKNLLSTIQTVSLIPIFYSSFSRGHVLIGRTWGFPVK